MNRHSVHRTLLPVQPNLLCTFLTLITFYPSNLALPISKQFPKVYILELPYSGVTSEKWAAVRAKSIRAAKRAWSSVSRMSDNTCRVAVSVERPSQNPYCSANKRSDRILHQLMGNQSLQELGENWYVPYWSIQADVSNIESWFLHYWSYERLSKCSRKMIHGQQAVTVQWWMMKAGW